jgi:hypothetical protein
MLLGAMWGMLAATRRYEANASLAKTVSSKA